MLVLDPRAKILAAFLLILSTVLASGYSVAATAGLVLVVLGFCVLWEAPIARVFKAALIVLPFAGAIALFAPFALWGKVIGGQELSSLAAVYTAGWPLAALILVKGYLSALLVSLVAESTTPQEAFAGLQALKIPSIFITLFTFLYRYTGLFKAEIRAMRQALSSRAPQLGRIQTVFVYGKLGGNLFIRAYERGERLYDAMVSRGYNGRILTKTPLIWTSLDTALVCLSGLAALALFLIS